MKLLTILILFIGIIFILIFAMTRGGCADTKQFCNAGGCFNAQPYGVFDGETKEKGVRYKVSVGNVVLSAIFIETIFVPVILCGWYLWEPVGLERTK